MTTRPRLAAARAALEQQAAALAATRGRPRADYARAVVATLEQQQRDLVADRASARRAAAVAAVDRMRELAGIRRSVTFAFTGPVNSTLRRRLIADLEGAWDADVTITFNSPGGNLADGLAIADAVREMREAGIAVTGVARGQVASAATLAYVECSNRIAEEGATFLLHRCELPDLGERNTAVALRQQADRMESFDRKILALYQRRGLRLTADQHAAFDRGDDVTFEAAFALFAGLVHEAPTPARAYLIGSPHNIARAPAALRPALRHTARLAAQRARRLL